MQEFKNNFNRRLFLKGAGAAAGAGALSMTPIQMAFAAAFPERNIQTLERLGLAGIEHLLHSLDR